jgi:hypothetical protein
MEPGEYQTGIERTEADKAFHPPESPLRQPLEPTPAANIPTPPPPPRAENQGAVAAALRAAAGLDWTTIDLDLPASGFVNSVGAEITDATATILCDCGTSLVLALDGESRARCPNCKAIFRHALLVQREDMTPATPCLLIDAMLTEAGVRP